MRGASKEDAAARDPPRVNSALIRVCINGQELLALLDTGCEVDLVSAQNYFLDSGWRQNLAVVGTETFTFSGDLARP